MSGLHIERHVGQSAGLARDIAGHLRTRQLHGGVVVISRDPRKLLAAVRREWRTVIRDTPRDDRAAMEQLRFMAGVPKKKTPGDGVFFASVAQLLDDPPACHTLYLTLSLDAQTITRLTNRMPEHGLVVLYETGDQNGLDDPPINMQVQHEGSI